MTNFFIRVAKFLYLQNKNKNEKINKIFLFKLYPANIDVLKYLMHIAKNCIHYSSLENLDFLK
jgi:hypothetical protein